jgi:hypothetical protein
VEKELLCKKFLGFAHQPAPHGDGQGWATLKIDMTDLSIVLTAAGMASAATAWVSIQVTRSAAAARKEACRVAKELQHFKEHLPVYLNGTYRRTPECELLHKSVEKQFSSLPALLAGSEEFRRLISVSVSDGIVSVSDGIWASKARRHSHGVSDETK